MAVVVVRIEQKKIIVIGSIIFFLLLVFLPNCSQVSAGFASNFERSLGKSAFDDIVKQYGGEYIVPIQERLWLDEVFQRLVAVTEREELDYQLIPLNSHAINAFALPGGYVFVTRGLLNLVGKEEAKLAAVLGHEIAHIEKKHSVNAVLRQMGLTVLVEVGVLWLDLGSADLLRLATATLLQLMHLGWGREAEYEADLVGQELAVKAGFDAVGALSLLDDLLEQDPDDLPLKLFRSHPETTERRARLENNLLSYWLEPRLLTDPLRSERLNVSRNYDQDGRSDPNNRYEIELPSLKTDLGLQVYDRQRQQTETWLAELDVLSFTWSPTGRYLTAVVQNEAGYEEVLLCDRHGYVLKVWNLTEHEGQIEQIVWSPDEKIVALQLQTDTMSNIVLSFLDTEVFLPITGQLGGSEPSWIGKVLYFQRDGNWYYTQGPEIRPVVVPAPIPQVVERKRLLSPTVVKEGNTIRLTSPTLSLP